MLFVNPLNEIETTSLQLMFKHHPLYWTRLRAHAVLLSAKKIPLKDMAKIFSVCRQTVSIWLKNWEKDGLCGLIDQPGRGRRKKLSESQEAEVINLVKESPRSLNKVLSEIEENWGVKLSKSTLKRMCKRAKLSWRRVRKSLRKKRDSDEFNEAVELIKNLIDEENKGDLDLYYFDGSGFTLEPCVPYAWQVKGEQIEIPSSKSHRLNVLGFINHKCDFESYVFECNVTSEVVVACFDEFAKTVTKKTVVILDNASMHTCNLFKSNIEKWGKNNLIIQYIPPYSPELNKIEILWRKIKYEWLDFSAYKSFKELKKSLNYILANIGQEYRINFT